LQDLLVPDAYLGRTPLAWLGVGPTSSSPAAVKAELEKAIFGALGGLGLGLRLASIAAGFARSVWPSEISHL
jgi:hypothetical protein